MQNRHPVDQLADVRAEIKRLEATEADLRRSLLVEGADLEGEEFRGSVNVSSQNRLNREMLEKRFGSEAVAECCIPIEVVYLRVIARTRLRMARNQRSKR
jgi:hypothetical protein